MSPLKSRYDKAYLRLLAGACLLLCGAGSVYFIGMDLDAGQGMGVVPPSFQVQVLCFLGTVSATAFFVRPRAGHCGLIGVSVAALCLGWTGTPPIVLAIQLLVLAMLLLPQLPPLSFLQKVTVLARRAALSTTVQDSVS